LKIGIEPANAGGSAVGRFAGSIAFVLFLILGLAPQALCLRPLRGLGPGRVLRGLLKPSYACFAGC
jgi:hypothetical protein